VIIGLIIMTTFLLAGGLHAQPPDSLWHRAYGDSLSDRAFSVVLMPDGGYMAAGVMQVYYPDSSILSADMYVVRTDANGDSLWTKMYGGGMGDASHSIIQTSDGNYVMAGYTCRSRPLDLDLYVVKIDADGNLIWDKVVGGTRGDEVAYCVCEAPDSSLRVVGTTDAYGDEDVLLVGLAADASWAWDRAYEAPGYQHANHLEFTPDGGIIIAATYNTPLMDVYLIKAESGGDTIWTRKYDFGSSDYGAGVKPVGNYAYIVTGYAEGVVAPDYNAFLMQVDLIGNIDWVEFYGGPGDDYSQSVEVLPDGGFIFAGYTDSYGAGGADVYLVRTDDVGNEYWTATYGGVNDDHGWGQTSSFGQGYIDLYMVKTEGDPAGVDVVGTAADGTLFLEAIPNPSTGKITIRYRLPGAESADMTVYDLLGRRVRVLESREHAPGLHSLTWDGRDEGGRRVAPGIYFCCLKSGIKVATHKIVMIR
jgi:hypothetical protein